MLCREGRRTILLGLLLGASLAVYRVSGRCLHAVRPRDVAEFGTNAELKILVEGDPGLLNRYDVILLDPLRHPEAKQERNSGAQSRPISNA